MTDTQRSGGKAIAVALGVAVLLVAGIWIAGLMAPNLYVHAAISAVWVVLVALGVLAITRNAPDLRRAAWGTYVATIVVVLAAGAFLARPTEVDEEVVTAPPASASDADSAAPEAAGAPEGNSNVLVGEGKFESLAHDTRGRAQVIELADGTKKLTLTGFKTDAGPDLFVFAVPGDPEGDGDVKDYLNLGSLKGTSGDQQYDLPRNFDAEKYDAIYIWCRAFTVGFGRATIA